MNALIRAPIPSAHDLVRKPSSGECKTVMLTVLQTRMVEKWQISVLLSTSLMSSNNQVTHLQCSCSTPDLAVLCELCSAQCTSILSTHLFCYTYTCFAPVFLLYPLVSLTTFLAEIPRRILYPYIIELMQNSIERRSKNCVQGNQ